jgi:hypothetical protein
MKLHQLLDHILYHSDLQVTETDRTNKQNRARDLCIDAGYGYGSAVHNLIVDSFWSDDPEGSDIGIDTLRLTCNAVLISQEMQDPFWRCIAHLFLGNIGAVAHYTNALNEAASLQGTNRTYVEQLARSGLYRKDPEIDLENVIQQLIALGAFDTPRIMIKLANLYGRPWNERVRMLFVEMQARSEGAFFSRSQMIALKETMAKYSS